MLRSSRGSDALTSESVPDPTGRTTLAPVMHPSSDMHVLKLLIASFATLALAACATPTTTPTRSPVAPTLSPTPADTPSPVASPTVTGATSPAPGGGPVLGEAQECENEELGYEVHYPESWWANDRIEPEEEHLTPIAACQYFAPAELDLQPNAGLPTGLAIWFRMVEGEPMIGDGDTVLEERETTVSGHEALVIEREPAAQPGFVPEGSRMYQYAIELDDAHRLVVTTDDIHQDRHAYEESAEILDAMMETLEIDG